MTKKEINDLEKRFLINSDDTGRFIVKSIKTGKTYFVEALDGKERTSWVANRYIVPRNEI